MAEPVAHRRDFVDRIEHLEQLLARQRPPWLGPADADLPRADAIFSYRDGNTAT